MILIKKMCQQNLAYHDIKLNSIVEINITQF